jgi:hypothetical protein
MGKVEKFVKTREKEKHMTTDEYIETLCWYVKACQDLDQEWVRSKNDLQEAFKSRIEELKAKEASK